MHQGNAPATIRTASWAGLGPRLHRIARAGLALTLDLLIPPACLVCRRPLANAGCLCGACWASIDFVRPPLCERIGIPLPFDVGAPSVSAAALAMPPVYDRARVVAAYDGTMRDLVHAYKYADRSDATALFGRWLLDAAHNLLRQGDLVVPVPLSRTRLLARRYNQAALLARALVRAAAKERASQASLTYEPMLLYRRRRTRSQVGLSVAERKRNVQGAFAIRPARASLLQGRGVILVDDVITSGATADACARTLKRHGAARVDVVALARVLDPLRPPV